MQKNRPIHHRIELILDDLSKSERKIAILVLEQAELVLSMTVNELANASNTSPASVIRFCKSIGIASFTDLKVKLSAESVHRELPPTTDISSNTSIPEIKQRLLSNAYQAMDETLQLLNESLVHQATNQIKEASIVYIFGIGSSFLVAENFIQKWTRIGKTVLCFSDVHIFITSLSSAPADALFIGISNSGETKEIISLMQIAKEHGLKTLSFTQFGNNTLSKLADFSIQTVHSNEAKLRSAATSSLMAQFITLDLLFYAYILEGYDDNIARIQQSRQDLDIYKQKHKKK